MDIIQLGTIITLDPEPSYVLIGATDTCDDDSIEEEEEGCCCCCDNVLHELVEVLDLVVGNWVKLSIDDGLPVGCCVYCDPGDCVGEEPPAPPGLFEAAP